MRSTFARARGGRIKVRLGDADRGVVAGLLEAVADLLDPENRVNVRHPSGWTGPGFLIGPDRDVILWGFTAGIIARLFSYLGWGEDWDRARVRDLPDHMLQGVLRGTDLAEDPPQNTRLEE